MAIEIEDVKPGDFEAKRADPFAARGNGGIGADKIDDGKTEKANSKGEKPKSEKLTADRNLKPEEQGLIASMLVALGVATELLSPEAEKEQAKEQEQKSEERQQAEEAVAEAAANYANNIDAVLATAITRISEINATFFKPLQGEPDEATKAGIKEEIDRTFPVDTEGKKSGESSGMVREAEDALAEAKKLAVELNGAVANLQRIAAAAGDALAEVTDGLSELSTQASFVDSIVHELSTALSVAKAGGYPHNIGVILSQIKGLNASVSNAIDEKNSNAAEALAELEHEIHSNYASYAHEASVEHAKQYFSSVFADRYRKEDVERAIDDLDQTGMWKPLLNEPKEAREAVVESATAITQANPTIPMQEKEIKQHAAEAKAVEATDQQIHAFLEKLDPDLAQRMDGIGDYSRMKDRGEFKDKAKEKTGTTLTIEGRRELSALIQEHASGTITAEDAKLRAQKALGTEKGAQREKFAKEIEAGLAADEKGWLAARGYLRIAPKEIEAIRERNTGKPFAQWEMGDRAQFKQFHIAPMVAGMVAAQNMHQAIFELKNNGKQLSAEQQKAYDAVYNPPLKRDATTGELLIDPKTKHPVSELSVEERFQAAKFLAHSMGDAQRIAEFNDPSKAAAFKKQLADVSSEKDAATAIKRQNEEFHKQAAAIIENRGAELSGDKFVALSSQASNEFAANYRQQMRDQIKAGTLSAPELKSYMVATGGVLSNAAVEAKYQLDKGYIDQKGFADRLKQLAIKEADAGSAVKIVALEKIRSSSPEQYQSVVSHLIHHYQGFNPSDPKTFTAVDISSIPLMRGTGAATLEGTDPYTHFTRIIEGKKDIGKSAGEQKGWEALTAEQQNAYALHSFRKTAEAEAVFRNAVSSMVRDISDAGGYQFKRFFALKTVDERIEFLKKNGQIEYGDTFQEDYARNILNKMAGHDQEAKTMLMGIAKGDQKAIAQWNQYMGSGAALWRGKVERVLEEVESQARMHAAEKVYANPSQQMPEGADPDEWAKYQQEIKAIKEQEYDVAYSQAFVKGLRDAYDKDPLGLVGLKPVLDNAKDAGERAEATARGDVAKSGDLSKRTFMAVAKATGDAQHAAEVEAVKQAVAEKRGSASAAEQTSHMEFARTNKVIVEHIQRHREYVARRERGENVSEISTAALDKLDLLMAELDKKGEANNFRALFRAIENLRTEIAAVPASQEQKEALEAALGEALRGTNENSVGVAVQKLQEFSSPERVESAVAERKQGQGVSDATSGNSSGGANQGGGDTGATQRSVQADVRAVQQQGEKAIGVNTGNATVAAAVQAAFVVAETGRDKSTTLSLADHAKAAGITVDPKNPVAAIAAIERAASVQVQQVSQQLEAARQRADAPATQQLQTQLDAKQAQLAVIRDVQQVLPVALVIAQQLANDPKAQAAVAQLTEKQLVEKVEEAKRVQATATTATPLTQAQLMAQISKHVSEAFPAEMRKAEADIKRASDERSPVVAAAAPVAPALSALQAKTAEAPTPAPAQVAAKVEPAPQPAAPTAPAGNDVNKTAQVAATLTKPVVEAPAAASVKSEPVAVQPAKPAVVGTPAVGTAQPPAAIGSGAGSVAPEIKTPVADAAKGSLGQGRAQEIVERNKPAVVITNGTEQIVSGVGKMPEVPATQGGQVTVKPLAEGVGLSSSPKPAEPVVSRQGADSAAAVDRAKQEERTAKARQEEQQRMAEQTARDEERRVNRGSGTPTHIGIAGRSAAVEPPAAPAAGVTIHGAPVKATPDPLIPQRAANNNQLSVEAKEPGATKLPAAAVEEAASPSARDYLSQRVKDKTAAAAAPAKQAAVQGGEKASAGDQKVAAVVPDARDKGAAPSTGRV